MTPPADPAPTRQTSPSSRRAHLALAGIAVALAAAAAIGIRLEEQQRCEPLCPGGVIEVRLGDNGWVHEEQKRTGHAQVNLALKSGCPCVYSQRFMRMNEDY